MRPVGSIAGIVLAGGRSSRMGSDNKAFLQLAGTTLLTHAIERLRPQVGTLAVNSNVAVPGCEYPVIADPQTGYPGPLAGILSGMNWARNQNITHIATVACDTPFFPLDLVDHLHHGIDGKHSSALAASAARLHPVFGLWSVELADDLSSYLENDPRRSVLAFAERQGFATVTFDIDPDALDPFFNINTRQDLAEAEQLAQKCPL